MGAGVRGVEVQSRGQQSRGQRDRRGSAGRRSLRTRGPAVERAPLTPDPRGVEWSLRERDRLEVSVRFIVLLSLALCFPALLLLVACSDPATPVGDRDAAVSEADVDEG